MRMYFIQSMRCLCALAMSLGMLTMFMLLFNHTGIHIKNPSGATDYKWESNQWKASMEEGFAWMHMDANGYNNQAAPQAGEVIDILLMGSSQVEGLHVRQSETLPSLMNEYLPACRTYSIGISGHTIYHCVSNLSRAYQVYQPRKAICLVIDRIDLTKNDMEKVISGEWSRIPSYDSGMLYRIQKTVPVVKALYKNLDDWKRHSRPKRHRMVRKTGRPAVIRADDYEETLRQFLAHASSALKGTGCRLVMCYQPPTLLERSGQFQKQDPSVRERFGRMCQENGIEFIDMTDSFEQLYYRKSILAHGFANTAVGRGHLNVHGYREIARELVHHLNQRSQ